MRVVAIDQGTSSTRGFVLDDSGVGEIVCTREHKQSYPHSGWVEHDPEELLSDITVCLKAALATGKIDAIGIDNQGESCLAWNKQTGQAISPVIVWQDRRTEAKITKLKSDGAEDVTMARAGLPLDPYFSASKMAWIIENNPEAKILLMSGNLCVGTTDAFFNHRLTGNFYTDITTASRTSLLNLETGQWDSQLCELFGVPMDVLPDIRSTMGNFGNVDVDGQKIALMASVVDQQASLYGHGCREPGDAKITFGTGAFVLALTGNSLLQVSEKGLLPTVAWQSDCAKPVYALDGGVYCASSALNWAKGLGLFKSFDELNQFDGAAAIDRNLAFVPALTGIGCPYWDGSAAGLWIGMSLDTTRNDLVQAILEGVAFRAAQVVDAMAGQVDIDDQISIDGGMSVNPWFCQLLADVLQKKIFVQTRGELTALGTALMAMGPGGEDHGRAGNGRIYDPMRNYNEAKAKFAEAVARSQNWRPNG